MFLDESMKGGGGYRGQSCCGCRQEIREGERSVRVEFRTDPHGHKGLTGLYHSACSRMYASLAHVINLNPWSGR